MKIIYPYIKGNEWVFDDNKYNLKEEPFILGSSEIINAIIKFEKINIEKGIQIQFNETRIPNAYQLLWAFAENDGNWYDCVVNKKMMRGWLCPALFHYFNDTPTIIYFKIEELKK